MPSIKHRIIYEVQPEQLFRALTTLEGLSAWWTRAESDHPSEANNMINFRFGPDGEHVVQMKVAEVTAPTRVVWKCIAGPWEATDNFTFSIDSDTRGSALTFENSGWSNQDDFYAHCNAKWGFFLTVSLKNYLETGKGMPHPADPNI